MGEDGTKSEDLEIGGAGAPRSPRLDRVPEIRELSPEPQVSAAAARPSDTGAGTGRLTAGCAAVSHRKPPRALADPGRGGPGTPTAPGERTLTWGGRGSSETAHRQVSGRGRAGLRARTEGPEQPRPPQLSAHRPSWVQPSPTPPECYNLPRI